MFCAESIDDLSAARDNVANDSTAGRGRELSQHLGWKTVRVSRKGRRDMNTRNFPMPGGAVFPGRRGVHQTPCANRRVSRIRAFERHKVPETARGHRREIEASDCRRKVTECVASGIAVRHCIGRSTGTDSIEDDYRCAPQLILPSNTDRAGRGAR